MLKKCPFCGGKAEILHGAGDFVRVKCIKCGAGTLWRANAVELWNKRPRVKLKLQNCPLCHSSAKLHVTIQGEYVVQCNKCGLTSDFSSEAEEVIEAWNTRQPPQ